MDYIVMKVFDYNMKYDLYIFKNDLVFLFCFKQIDNLQEIIQQHAGQIAGLEKERDFYYQKLRDVEVICQEPDCESSPHIQKILEILYATEVCRKIFLLFYQIYKSSTYL